jgi:hypothetical protein
MKKAGIKVSESPADIGTTMLKALESAKKKSVRKSTSKKKPATKKK